MRSKYVSAEFRVYYYRLGCNQTQKIRIWVFPDTSKSQLQSGTITLSLFGEKNYSLMRGGFLYGHPVPFYPTPAMVKAVQEYEEIRLSCRILMQMDYSTSGYSSRRKS